MNSPIAQYLIDLIVNLGYESPIIGEPNDVAFAKIIRCVESLAIKAKMIKPEEVNSEGLRDDSLGQMD